MTFLRAGRAAVTFLTRLPVGGFPYREAEWQWSSAWFPAVGALLGAIYAGVWLGVAPALGAPVAAVCVVAAALLVTGAFHEDGLADSADALGGAYTRERVLEILKDSRIGTFGGAALFVSLGLRCALLVRLGPHAPAALVLTECLSRLPPLWLMCALPYVTADAHSKSRQIARARPAQAIAATLLTAAVVVAGVLFSSWPLRAAALACATAAAVGALCAWRFHARLGGVTGDFLGATQQACVCATLAAIALTPAG